MQPANQTTDAPADPLATQTAGGGSPESPSPAAPDAVSVDIDEVRSLLLRQQQTIDSLQRDLAGRPSGGAPITSTAPIGGPAPAAAGSGGVPAHATLASLPTDLEPGSIVRFAGVSQANGADPLSGYAIVLDVVDVPDVAETTDPATGAVRRSQLDSTHPEVVAARLDVMGFRLQAGNIVDEDTSAKIQSQHDRAGG